jgi:hypothetical protein
MRIRAAALPRAVMRLLMLLLNDLVRMRLLMMLLLNDLVRMRLQQGELVLLLSQARIPRRERRAGCGRIGREPLA